MELYQLRQMQSLPLEAKIIKSKLRIREWYEHWDGQVAISVSGGLDSTVLAHLVREDYPDVPGFFVNTRLELKNIVDFVRSMPNVTTLYPKKTFQEVVREYGYPVVSKDISRSVYYARRGSHWALNRFKGLNVDGTPSDWYANRQMKYAWLLDAPFLISDACCKHLKLEPLAEIDKQYKPFIGLRADESDRRRSAWLQTGCNAFNSKHPHSTPLAFWSRQNILRYIKDYQIPYASGIYGDIVEDKHGKLSTTLETRTGCAACLLGQSIRRKKGTETRFQRLKRMHPAQWAYCMKPLEEGGLGMKPVLEFMGIPYE